VLCDLVQRLGLCAFGSSIPVPLNELAICMTGRKWGSQYEFYEHRRASSPGSEESCALFLFPLWRTLAYPNPLNWAS
jgi:hypothetical protein